MKVRDSGMPEPSYWESLFDVDNILNEMLVDASVHNLLEVGSGYGTFTMPAARRINGTVYAFDIEEEMTQFLSQRLTNEAILNVKVYLKDFLEESLTEMPLIDYIMLFNIMHHHAPLDFLQKAFDLLPEGGRIGIIHWRSDIETPRGPNLSIRPKPEDILALVEETKFTVVKSSVILPPYHYGIVLQK